MTEDLAGRSERGSTLVLIAAVTMGLVVALIFFCLNYSRLLGSNAEQKKAIESAALSAAHDISNIVINTDECGYVSMSDQAPIGKNTGASDQFYLPVHGINTLVGTARLDAIIADQMPNSGLMSTLAQNDLANAKTAINKLTTVIKASLTPAGSPLALDADGNAIAVYNNALNAYLQNAIRMTGSSQYAAGSLQLSLGSSSSPTETNIPVPQPSALAPVPASLQQDNNYKSFVNIPFKNSVFVFGGIGNSPRLLDVRGWVANLPTVAYQVPTVVKAECDQMISTSQSPNGALFHTAACAQASSVFDPKPAPGAISIEFPDGKVGEFKKPGDLLSNAALNSGNADILTAAGGDFPSDYPACSMSTSPNPWPPGASPTSIADSWRVTLYDWIRRAGTRAKIDKVVNMQNTLFNLPNPARVDWQGETSLSPVTVKNITALYSGPQIPFGIMHIYKFTDQGDVLYKSQPVSPYPYQVLSENQLYAEIVGSNAFTSPNLSILTFTNVSLPVIQGKTGLVGTVTFSKYLDVYVRDQTRQPGTILGGKHGGEPLNDVLVAYNAAKLKNIAMEKEKQLEKDDSRLSAFDYGAGGLGACGGCCGGGFCGQCPPFPPACTPPACCGPPPPVPPPPPTPGNGTPPLLGRESDFGDPQPQIVPEPYLAYSKGPGSGAVRPTYQVTGLSGSIRFRRQIKVDAKLKGVAYKDTGYIASKTAMPIVTYTAPYPAVTTDLNQK